MSKKLIILIFSLFIPFTYAGITPNASQKIKIPVYEKQRKSQNQSTSLTQELLSPVDLPITQSQLQGNNQRDLSLPNKKTPKEKNYPRKVLPDLFNMPTEQDHFGIKGDVIKSVDSKEKGDIDGANIQFIFRS